MSEQRIQHSPSSGIDQPELGVLNIMIALAKHKKKLLGVPLGAALLSALISLALPDVFRASAKLLPPQQQQGGAAALLSQLGGVAALGAGAAGIKSPSDLYIGILKSRTVADAIIKKHDLTKIYGFESLERTRAELAENTVVATGKDGLITIDVMDRDRLLVAPITNSYIDELMKLTRVLAVTEAAQRRLFFERQLEKAKNNLANAEISLKGGLDSRGVISVDGQSRSIIETVGRLRAQVSAKQIQLGAMEAFVTKNNPEYRRVSEELISLRTELQQLENGRSTPLRPTSSTSSDGLANIKILRDVKYYQMLYEMLAKQYEAARLDEARDNNVIQVLDSAIAPERKIAPKRAIIVLVTSMIALVLALAWIFLLELKQSILQRPEGRERWAKLVAHVRTK